MKNSRAILTSKIPERQPIYLELDLQIAPGISKQLYVPEYNLVEKWILSTLSKVNAFGEKHLTVRIVDETEIKTLNKTYRHKSGATNVLSFPFEAPADVPLPLLGDIVVCAPVVQKQAQQQNKAPEIHWAHMIVHGTLHLLGYDHISPQQAEEMESIEIDVLAEFDIPDPYKETLVQ